MTISPDRVSEMLAAATPGPWRVSVLRRVVRNRLLSDEIACVRYTVRAAGDHILAEARILPARIGEMVDTLALVAAAPDIARAYLAACEERDALRAALVEAGACLSDAARRTNDRADQQAWQRVHTALAVKP